MFNYPIKLKVKWVGVRLLSLQRRCQLSDLPRFAAARCDLDFFGMSQRSGRALLGFLLSWHPEASDQTVHISHHWGTGCSSVFCSQSCEILLPTIPQTVWGTAQPLWYFPSEISNQQVISWKLYIVGELPKLRTLNWDLFFPLLPPWNLQKIIDSLLRK